MRDARVMFADEGIERRGGYDRRELSMRTFMQGGLTPRRRGGRRAGEGHALVDWHEPHLLFMSLMILLLSVTDAFLTLTLMTHGATEANPVLAYVLADHPELFALVKLTLTGIGILVLVALARARVFRIIRVSAVMQSCLVLYIALICYEWWMLEAIL
ncbi:MAG: DUF5658 family protein [Gammaproteobacteria bacterium]|nr:DUF5658 family protein [Gammaproteobacteria bacterium]MDH3506677.1 DUF5658 family protein [Gammaproteobacteria bacterium]